MNRKLRSVDALTNEAWWTSFQCNGRRKIISRPIWPNWYHGLGRQSRPDLFDETANAPRQRVAGWNEIDAVELIGRDGSRQWAKGANASSSYGASRGLSFGGDVLQNNWGGQGRPTPNVHQDTAVFGLELVQ